MSSTYQPSQPLGSNEQAVFAAAMALPDDRRAELAEVLLGSLPPAMSQEIEEAWIEESEARLEAFEKGEIQAIPAEEVFRSLRERRTLVGDVELLLQDRSSVFTAVVEPGRSDALIGAIVLEELEFLADCGQQRLVPRDPREIVTEVE